MPADTSLERSAERIYRDRDRAGVCHRHNELRHALGRVAARGRPLQTYHE